MLKRKNNWILELILIIILLALPLSFSQINITALVSFSILPEEQIIQESSEEQFDIQPIENLSVQLKNETFEIPSENKSFIPNNYFSITSWRNMTDGFSTETFGSWSPYGITRNGTDFWIADNGDAFVYHTDKNGNNITDGFSTWTIGSGYNTYGITTNGSDFWIVDYIDDFVYHTDKNGNNQTDGFKISTFGSGAATGITTNGSDFWIADDGDNFIYHTNRTGNNQTDGFSTWTIGSGNPYGITTNGSDFWIADDGDNFIYHVNRTGNNQTDGFSTVDFGSDAPYSIVSNISSYDSSNWRNPTDFWIADDEDNFVYHIFFNNPPTLSLIYIISDDDTKNTTIVNLTGTFSITDVDGDSMTINETNWYNNSIEETNLRNHTIILSGNTSELDRWMFSARTYDGTDWSSWTNSSNFTILRDCLCSSCSECISELNSSTCSIVNLTGDITNQATTCINNPTNFSNKIFDCQRHTIDGTDASGSRGINLNSKKQNNTIQNCIVSDFDKGIFLGSSSNNNTLFNNTAYSNINYGIQIYSSSNSNRIIANNASLNDVGIAIDTSSFNNIINNTANSNAIGITSDSGTSNNYTNNNISYNTYGFYFLASNDNILKNNTITKNPDLSQIGLFIYATKNLDLNNTIDATNTIDGLPINYSDGKSIACPNDMSLDLGSSYSWFGLNSCNNVTVTASNNLDHILLGYTTNSTINSINVTFSVYALHLFNSSGNNIINSTFNSNLYGIFPIYSSNNVFANNTINYNTIGIRLFGGSNNVITNNTFNSNTWWGINPASTSSNNFTLNTAQNNSRWDYYSTSSSTDVVTNLTTYQNLISFTSKDIALRGLQSSEAPSNPIDYSNVNEWINVTNNSADSWVYLNFSYPDSSVDESTLEIWRYNGTNWNKSGFYKTSILDISKNVVGANITNFSIFAPFGTALPGPTGGPSHVYPRKEIPEKNITKPEGKKSEIPEKKEEKPFIFGESPTKIQTNLKEYIPLSVAIILIILFLVYYFFFKKHKINKNKKYSKNHAINRSNRKKKKY